MSHFTFLPHDECPNCLSLATSTPILHTRDQGCTNSQGQVAMPTNLCGCG
jgi:hypothetical protein